MYDSSSKYPGGILSGEVNELGYFDQCMSVSSKQLGIYGAYVLVNIRFRFSDENISEILDLAEIDQKRSKVIITIEILSKNYGDRLKYLLYNKSP